jgi:Hypothetical glycosyl hydrolase family 15/S-layer homology domain
MEAGEPIGIRRAIEGLDQKVIASRLVALGLVSLGMTLSSGGTFVDDDDSVHEGSIEAIAAESITLGCNPPDNDRFCPDDPVDRGMMAAFLARAFDLPETPEHFFNDDDGHLFESAINRLAARGITKGCDPPANERFCPDDDMTRGAMAAMLSRAFHYPESNVNRFADDDGHLFEDAIQRIAAAGVTVGCNPPQNDEFCPNDTVTRAEMATFLTRALDLKTTRSSRGSIELYVFAKSGFDEYTDDPSVRDRAWMRDHYEFMTVWSPYFDSRLSWFPKGVEYSDVMALKDRDHPEWILEDSSGDPLYVDFACSGGSCPQYAADIGNQDFRDWFIAELKAVAAEGYAGFYLDDVNMSWRISNGSERVEPIDPRTGKTMTLGAWRRYMADFVEQIERQTKGIIVHNPLWTADSPHFNDPTVARQLAAADWVQIEHGYNDGGLRGGDGRYAAQSLFAYVDWVHSLGTKVMWLEEDGGSDAKHESNLAAYLLTYAPGDVISTEDWAAIAPDSIWEGYLLDLGAPLARRTQTQGLFRREFQHGTVLVNEPDNNTKTVQITGTRIDGTRVSQVSIPPGTGIIIKHD